jgi:short-subunit dehydrogenase
MSRLRLAARDLETETGGQVQAYDLGTGSDTSVNGMMQRAAADMNELHILINAAATPGGYKAPPTLADL